MIQRVAVCGAPLTGKTTILMALGQISGTDKIQRSFSETENLARLDVDLNGKQVTFITISGNFNHTSSKVVSKILSGASLVIYVFSALTTVQQSFKEQKREIEEINRQRLFWGLYTQEADLVGASWRTTPWVFVLNKVDLGTRNPLSQEIPESLQYETFSCIATQNHGIAQLSEKVGQLLK